MIPLLEACQNRGGDVGGIGEGDVRAVGARDFAEVRGVMRGGARLEGRRE